MDWNRSAPLLGGGKTAPPADLEACFQCGLWALAGGRYAEGYSLFAACGEEEPAVCFNLALTLYLGSLHQQALLFLEKAVHHLPAIAGSTAPMLPPPPMELEWLEDEGEGYLQPMPRELPRLCPTGAKCQILRLKAEVLLALGLREELHKLMPLLAKRPYARLGQIQNQLNGE